MGTSARSARRGEKTKGQKSRVGKNKFRIVKKTKKSGGK
jgi:hypothetical protein